MFNDDTSIDDYELFMVNYYSRLSNIKIDSIEQWMSKTRKLKAKILSTSSYLRDLFARRIQIAFRKASKRGIFFKSYLSRHIIEKYKLSKKLEYNDLSLKEFICNNSSKIISRFFRKIISKKLLKLKEEAKYNIGNTFKLKERTHLLEALVNKINVQRSIRSGTLLTKLGTHTVQHMFKKDHIVLPNTFNNEKKWFGFNRNRSLENLVLSTGSVVDVLDIKLSYTKKEFLRILKCIADICSVTKSRQFVKLCRVFSGSKHRNNSLNDFFEGYCWMFDKLTRWDALYMIQLFCKSTLNKKWMIYMTNNDAVLDEAVRMWNLR